MKAIAEREPLLSQAWVTKVTNSDNDSPSVIGGASMTEFEKQIAANLARAEVQRLNKELQRDDAETAAVQNLNTSVKLTPSEEASFQKVFITSPRRIT